MLNLRFNYPSVKAEADIFEQYVRGLPEHEKYGILTPASFWPDRSTVQLLGQWLELPPETLQQRSGVISTCSGNSALHCILTWFRDTEQTAAIEEFTYTSFKASAGELGYDLHTIACDAQGNIAAATSTGGMTNKKYGRIGDSPLIGAGTYANNKTCAISATGHGEPFIRGVAAYDVSCLMEYKGLSLHEAMNIVVNDKLVKLEGEGGMIGVDAQGNAAMIFNSAGMYRAMRNSDGEGEVAIYR